MVHLLGRIIDVFIYSIRERYVVHNHILLDIEMVHFWNLGSFYSIVSGYLSWVPSKSYIVFFFYSSKKIRDRFTTKSSLNSKFLFSLGLSMLPCMILSPQSIKYHYPIYKDYLKSIF